MGKWEMGPFRIFFVVAVLVVAVSAWSIWPFSVYDWLSLDWMRGHQWAIIGIIAGGAFALLYRPRYNPHG